MIDVWWSGRSINLQPNKTNETENGKIAVTIIPGLIEYEERVISEATKGVSEW